MRVNGRWAWLLLACAWRSVACGEHAPNLRQVERHRFDEGRETGGTHADGGAAGAPASSEGGGDSQAEGGNGGSVTEPSAGQSSSGTDTAGGVPSEGGQAGTPNEGGQAGTDGGPEPTARLQITEVNALVAFACDLIEVQVIQAGNLEGIQVLQRADLLVTLPALSVKAGDIIVVHANAFAPKCNLAGATREVSVMEQPSSQYTTNYDTALDFWSALSTFTATDNVIQVIHEGEIQDAVFLTDGVDADIGAASEVAAVPVAEAGEWQKLGGGVPPGGFVDGDFAAHAVPGLAATGMEPVGDSIQRLLSVDTNTKADWGLAKSTFGLKNF